MLKLFFVGIGGAIGALLRYEIDLYVGSKANLPLDTLVVNLIGCFLIGAFYRVFSYELLNANLRELIITGFLGALTTFSSYSYTTLHLLIEGSAFIGLINLFLNNTLGILLAFLGSQSIIFLVGRYRRKS